MPFKPNRREIVDEKGFEYLERLIEARLDPAKFQIFEQRAGEYVWFLTLRTDKSETFTEDETERALNFVFWWIVEWETVGPSFVDDRRGRHLRSMRRVRTNADRARIADVRVSDQTAPRQLTDNNVPSPTQWRVRLTLADTPSEEAEFDLWSRQLQSLLNQVPGVSMARGDESGSFDLYLSLTEGVTIEEFATRVRACLVDVEVTFKREMHLKLESKRSEEKADREYSEDIEKAAADIPSWIDRIEPGFRFESRNRYNYDYGSSHYTSDATTIHLSDRNAGPTMIRLLNDDPRVQSVARYSDKLLRLEPRIAVADLVELLRAIDSAVIENSRLLNSEMEEWTQKVAETRSKISSLLRD